MKFATVPDFHVLKYFSSFVSVSRGRVINITDPVLSYCPLARHLYKDFRNAGVRRKESIKQAIRSAIESKIKEYGFFTDDRKFSANDIAVPYGASEMLMYALRKKTIDAAVVVCDGAGTVATVNPEIVQAIGSRLNSIVCTSPVKGIIEKLKDYDCVVLSEDAKIDQIGGIRKAIQMGYKTIAVTICGYEAGDLEKLSALEKEAGVQVVSLAVCTTGVTADKISLMHKYADLVWSCSSPEVRRIIGPFARYQLSRPIPVTYWKNFSE